MAMTKNDWISIVLGAPLLVGFAVGSLTTPAAVFLSFIEHDWATYVTAICASAWVTALIPFMCIQFIDFEKLKD